VLLSPRLDFILRLVQIQMHSCSYYFYCYNCRLQAHVTQSSSSQGRLEQQLSERDAAIKDRDEKIVMLERKLTDSATHGDSLTSRLNEQELVVASKDRRINELNALIGDRSRYDVSYS